MPLAFRCFKTLSQRYWYFISFHLLLITRSYHIQYCAYINKQTNIELHQPTFDDVSDIQFKCEKKKNRWFVCKTIDFQSTIPLIDVFMRHILRNRIQCCNANIIGENIYESFVLTQNCCINEVVLIIQGYDTRSIKCISHCIKIGQMSTGNSY